MKISPEQVPVAGLAPVSPVVDKLLEVSFLAEVEGKVGGEDRRLDDVNSFAVLARREVHENVTAFATQDHETLVEVVVLHRRCRVQLSER